MTSENVIRAKEICKALIGLSEKVKILLEACIVHELDARDRAHAEEVKGLRKLADDLAKTASEKNSRVIDLEAELAEAKQEIKKSHHSLTVTADDNSRLRAALVLIRDEARENKTQGGAVARATVGVIQIIAEKAMTPDNAKRERRL